MGARGKSIFSARCFELRKSWMPVLRERYEHLSSGTPPPSPNCKCQFFRPIHGWRNCVPRRLNWLTMLTNRPELTMAEDMLFLSWISDTKLSPGHRSFVSRGLVGPRLPLMEQLERKPLTGLSHFSRFDRFRVLSRHRKFQSAFYKFTDFWLFRRARPGHV